jgi:hypothetical protein
MGYTKLNQNLVWFSEPKGAFTLVVIYFPTYKGPSLHMNQILTQVEVHPQLRRWNPALTQLRIFHSWDKPKPAQLRIFHSWVKLKPAQLRIFHRWVMAESSQATNEWRSGGGGFTIHSGPLLRDSGLFLTLWVPFPPITCLLLYTGPIWRPPHTITIIVNLILKTKGWRNEK